jgi:hypothetical protein
MLLNSKDLAKLEPFWMRGHWELLLLSTVIHLQQHPFQTLMQYAVQLGLHQKMSGTFAPKEDGTLLLCYMKHYQRQN